MLIYCALSGLQDAIALKGRNMIAMGIAHRTRDDSDTIAYRKKYDSDGHRPSEKSTRNCRLGHTIQDHMGQSLVKNYIHLTFSTKHRQPLIIPPFEQQLHSYLGGICKKMDCPPLKIGGYTDHVHILCMLSKKIALMTLMEEIKSTSSKWMKTLDESLNVFYWQDGYGAFSVNPSEVETVVKYIANQHAHHAKKTYQDEFRAFLKKYKVEYDERYVWE